MNSTLSLGFLPRLSCLTRSHVCARKRVPHAPDLRNGWNTIGAVRGYPEIAQRVDQATQVFTKVYASVFAGTGLEAWLRESNIDTITLTGFMTNNCVIGSVAAAEPLGFNVEVLSDATGAINIANEAGSVSAQQIHETLMTLLQSNWAAVSTTDQWLSALNSGSALAGSNLIVSAAQGHEQYQR